MKKNNNLSTFFLTIILIMLLNVLSGCDTGLNQYNDTTWINTTSYISNNISWQTKQTLTFRFSEVSLKTEALPTDGELITTTKDGTYTYTADTISITFDSEVLNGTSEENIITMVSGEKTQVFLKQ